MNALLLDRYLAFIISIIRIVYVIGVGSDAARDRVTMLVAANTSIIFSWPAELFDTFCSFHIF